MQFTCGKCFGGLINLLHGNNQTVVETILWGLGPYILIIFGFGLSNTADFVTNSIIKLPQSEVTLCFQFVSAAVSVSVSAAAAMTFAFYVKTFCATS